MSGFTKLFQSIVTSSIWSEDDKTRIVWVTMLALADRGGLVEAALPGLANAARVSLEDCEGAVNKFLAPDKYSRTEEWEGRRIEKVDGGWRLLNHAAYRRKLSADDRLDYQRVKQAEYRDKKKPLKNVGLDGRPSSSAYKARESAAVKRFENGEVDKDFQPI
jgi:hypothetical protein